MLAQNKNKIITELFSIIEKEKLNATVQQLNCTSQMT